MKNGIALLFYSRLKIPENKDALRSVIGQFLMELFGLLAAGLPSAAFQNVMDPGRRVIPVFVNGLKMASLIIFFVS